MGTSFSKITPTPAPVTNSGPVTPEDETSFRQVFPKLKQDLNHVCDLGIESSDWFEKVLDYNVPHGKLQRGILIVNTFKALAQNPTDEQINSSRVLGWCCELMQSCSLVADDMMDSSPLRRGRPAWFMVNGVGMNAINDAFYLESSAYYLLKKYFGGTQVYTDLVETFHDITFKTVLGQNLDVMATKVISKDSFKMENYSKIATYKTSYYTFVLPLRLGALFAGVTDSKLLNQIEIVGLQLGEIFQAQDDFLDVYCTFSETGKKGTDIAEGKCTWLICAAMETATPEQLHLLEQNYGKRDEESVQIVKTVFQEMKLDQHFRQYRSESMDKVRAQIAAINGCPNVRLQAILKILAKKLEISNGFSTGDGLHVNACKAP